MTKHEAWKEADDQLDRKMIEDAAKNTSELRRLLDRAKLYQHKFWDALDDLEAATGLRDWGDDDLQAWTVDDILEMMEKAWRMKHPTQTVEPRKD